MGEGSTGVDGWVLEKCERGGSQQEVGLIVEREGAE